MTNVTFLVRDRFNLTRQTLDTFGDAGTAQQKSVTVLDDRSGTPTREFVECWCSDHNAAYIRNDIPMGTGPLRNVVINSSGPRGDYLYISDNDVAFFPGWLDILRVAYERAWEHGYRVLGAYGHPFHTPVSRFPINKGRYVLCNVDEVLAVATQSMFCRWEVYEEYGPFCDTPIDRVCQSEDVAFTNKIREAGFKLGVINPALVASTGITNSFGEKIPGWELVKVQCPKGVVCE